MNASSPKALDSRCTFSGPAENEAPQLSVLEQRIENLERMLSSKCDTIVRLQKRVHRLEGQVDGQEPW